VLRLERIIWRRASAEVGERTLEEFVRMFEVADCWRYGEEPMPSLERSVFLWHATLGDATLATRAAPALAQLCPVEEELYRAQQGAQVLVAQNRGGIWLRDVLFERPDIRIRSEWPNRFCAHARPVDRFLVRMPLFRNVWMLDELGVSQIVLGEQDVACVRTLLEDTGLTPSAPDWGWHIAAMWTAVATEDWARGELGALRGPTTRQ
jgi:hypothetical protein